MTLCSLSTFSVRLHESTTPTRIIQPYYTLHALDSFDLVAYSLSFDLAAYSLSFDMLEEG